MTLAPILSKTDKGLRLENNHASPSNTDTSSHEDDHGQLETDSVFTLAKHDPVTKATLSSSVS